MLLLYSIHVHVNQIIIYDSNLTNAMLLAKLQHWINLLAQIVFSLHDTYLHNNTDILFFCVLQLSLFALTMITETAPCPI